MNILGLIDIPLWLLLTALMLVLIYVYGTWPYSLFKSLGIPGPSPEPFVGNVRQMIAQSATTAMTNWTKKYGKVYGLYQARQPVMVVTDLDIIQHVLISEFAKCPDRKLPFAVIQDPLNKGIIFAKGDTWRRIRGTLNPTFSFAKLKGMMYKLNRSARSLTERLVEDVTKSEQLHGKDAFENYTMDVIASTVFGIDTNSQKGTLDPFLINVRKFFGGNINLSARVMLPTLFPFLNPIVRWLNIGLIPAVTLDFFSARVKEMLHLRRHSKDTFKGKPDFLQLMLNAEWSPGSELGTNENVLNGDVKELDPSAHRLTEGEMVGNGLIFFLAGFDTTSSLFGFLAYRLAMHQEVQQRVYEEICTIQHDEVTLEDVNKLSYTDQVISETLRLHPPTTLVARELLEDIRVGDVLLPKEALIWVPVMTVHTDPENFPDPLTFDPERFSPENKKAMHPQAFMAFGAGPRMCIGFRMALALIKVALVHMLKEVRLTRCKDTPEKVEYRSVILLQPTKPIPIKVVARN